MKNVFVFPCGSEIALEIAKSLKNSIHFHLIGGGSLSDHGEFVFDDIEKNLPWEYDPEFIPAIKEIVKRRNIDIIYPAMDSSIVKLKSAEKELGCKVICAPLETTNICLSKKKTYKLLSNHIRVPKLYSFDNVEKFPVFGKPDIGYGSRGTSKINDIGELCNYIQKIPESIICEYLPGEEFTIDCFTDRYGKLRFCGPRVRNRINNGISVNTFPVDATIKKDFFHIAERINDNLIFRGAWFFQMKRNFDGELVLLEIAARFGGSSALFRAQGINFAELSLWDALDKDIDILLNDFPIEMDRALDNCFKLQLQYDEVFIDYDDTIILQQKNFNTDVMKFLYQCKNNNVKLTLLSRHSGNLYDDLYKFGLERFFDRVIHIDKKVKKSDYIDNSRAIFVDDSFSERQDVLKKCDIPVFSVDALTAIIKN